MDNNGCLLVGALPVCAAEGVDDELLAVFRDDMAQVLRVPAEEYSAYMITDGPFVDEVKFRAPGRIIAARLDLIGIDAASTLAKLDVTIGAAAEPMDDAELANYRPWERAFIRREEAFLGALSAQGWLSMLAATPDSEEALYDKSLGSRGWLLDLLKDNDGWDVRRMLRAILLAFPDAEVSLDGTWLGQYGWPGAGPSSVASDAQTIVRGEAATHAPMIVLTEGKNDSEFLSVALMILYPHLTDLIRFLDYERRPEGGASAVLRTARAFAAAGVANRVVAILDNDTAAADELRAFGQARLPGHIRVMQYPPLDLARQYPTLGPPTVESPTESIALADVNGLAASIELYLGRHVLTSGDGELRPVQWKSYIAGMGRYQGEVTNKRDIHEAFRAKATAASHDSSLIGQQDWEGLSLILDALLTAFVPESSGPSL